MPGSGRAHGPRAIASQGGLNSSSPPNVQSNEATCVGGSTPNISLVISSEGTILND